jgi:hypothetical protein
VAKEVPGGQVSVLLPLGVLEEAVVVVRPVVAKPLSLLWQALV